MKNLFIALILATVMFTSGCHSGGTVQRQNTAANLPPTATVPPQVAADNKALLTFETASDGSELKTIAEVNQKISDNKNLIVLLQQANKYLAQKAVDIQTAIDQTYLYVISGFFGLAGIVLGVYGVVMAPLGTKSLFIKLGVLCGLIAALVITVSIYLPTIFAILKFFFLGLCGVALVVGVYYFHVLLSALHSNGVAGNLTKDAENLPIVGKVIADATKDMSALTPDISAAKTDLSNVRTEVSSGFAKVEAAVKKIL
jgi:hypothetical protein